MPSRTYPLSNGGSYLASDTRPLLSNSRAGFIACHPPALRRSFSVIGIALTSDQRRPFRVFAKLRAVASAFDIRRWTLGVRRLLFSWLKAGAPCRLRLDYDADDFFTSSTRR